MKFEWDKQKAELNISKHGISFEKSAFVFTDGNSLSIYDEAHSGEEDRWITMGQIPGGDVVVVVHAYRKKGKDEFIRIISVRKATKNEIRQYFETKQDE